MPTTKTGGARIHDEDGRVVGVCGGPLPSGDCPMVTAGYAVPCAGHVVTPVTAAGPAGWEMRVSPVATDCPMRSRRVWAKQPGHRWGPAATSGA